MRRVAGNALLFIVTIPPLIYFYVTSTDKNFAGVLLAVFGGFFVDRCLDALDRRELSTQIGGITNRLDETIRRLTVDAGALSRVPLATAFAYAESRLKGATKMLNTAWSTRGHGSSASGGYERWIAAIADAVADDGCVVEEVVASPERARAVTTILSQQKRLKGSYLVTDISGLFEKNPKIPFTEFVIFEHGHGKEVVFGWSTSRDYAISQDCFATIYPPVIDFFEAQFDRLAQLGPRTEGKSARGSELPNSAAQANAKAAAHGQDG